MSQTVTFYIQINLYPKTQQYGLKLIINNSKVMRLHKVQTLSRLTLNDVVTIYYTNS